MIYPKTNLGYSLSIVIAMFLMVLVLTSCLQSGSNATPRVSQAEIVSSSTITPSATSSKTSSPNLTKTPEPTVTKIASQTPTLTPILTTEPGATRISPVDSMVLVHIPAGEFLMGSSDIDLGADFDEIPQHSVYLEAIWMDKTVVTNAMYAAFLNEEGNQTEARTTWLDAGDEDVLIYQQNGVWHALKDFADHPAVEVTWFGAQAYCRWAGRRLPTEAEWEKAARGSISHFPQRDDWVGNIYPWGNEIDCDKAQYANCSGRLMPADNKPAGASPYGVLGLSGNTWEWVADWYAEDYYTTSPFENPFGPTDGETRTLRGGSWEYDWKHLRAANRRHNGPGVSMHDYSFRCADDDVIQ